MTYEYECLTCGRVFEIEQRITDPPLTECGARIYAVGEEVARRCGGRVKRLVSSPAVILKGKGWAKDGYGGGS